MKIRTRFPRSYRWFANSEILQIIEAPALSVAILERVRLYNETLPRAAEYPYTPQHRYLHFLWDAFDKTALSLIVPFSIPFRRLIAGHLFKSCGQAMIAEENVRFNFGNLLELGDGVFFSRGVFLDTKSGVRLGNSVALAEDVQIFTHTHSEASHIVRTYGRVVVEDYAKIYAGATIMPGVTVGCQAIAAAGSIVNQDVSPNRVVAGTPARVIRERKTERHRAANWIISGFSENRMIDGLPGKPFYYPGCPDLMRLTLLYIMKPEKNCVRSEFVIPEKAGIHFWQSFLDFGSGPER